jgi:hypothetical protein
VGRARERKRERERGGPGSCVFLRPARALAAACPHARPEDAPSKRFIAMTMRAYTENDLRPPAEEGCFSSSVMMMSEARALCCCLLSPTRARDKGQGRRREREEERARWDDAAAVTWSFGARARVCVCVCVDSRVRREREEEGAPPHSSFSLFIPLFSLSPRRRRLQIDPNPENPNNGPRRRPPCRAIRSL